MVHTPGSHLLTTNQTQIISKTRTHRSQQSILLQLFFATQCYTSGSEIWDLHAKLGLFWDQIWTLVPFGTKSQIWDFIIAPASLSETKAWIYLLDTQTRFPLKTVFFILSGNLMLENRKNGFGYKI